MRQIRRRAFLGMSVIGSLGAIGTMPASTSGPADGAGPWVGVRSLMDAKDVDASTALEAAIEQCRSQDSASVMFESGSFELGRPLKVSIGKLKIGSAPGVVVRWNPPSAYSGVLLEFADCAQLTISGVKMTFPSSARGDGYLYGIRIVDCDRVVVSDCQFSGGSSAVRIEATNDDRVRTVEVLRNRVRDGIQHYKADKAAAGIVVGAGYSGVTVASNIIDSYREEGIAIDAAASTPLPKTAIRNVNVQLNRIHGCGRTGINLRRVSEATVVENIVVACGNVSDDQMADGINVHTENEMFNADVDIIGNRVSDCEAGIGVDDTIRFSIRDNVVEKPARAWGIHVGSYHPDPAQRSPVGQAVIAGNQIYGTNGSWPGVALVIGRRYELVDNVIALTESASAIGIRVWPEARDVRIDRNEITPAGAGTPLVNG